ncbi:unnamed protein product [Prorocentrum cordatum]|uniref:Uncharacterized protein n=1 Tax=Prorocentrum cordatum TaxID=2364126 RepID=A0ABN9QBY4_9DINO|nr:unnamed protein product [Polarella glacialis]
MRHRCIADVPVNRRRCIGVIGDASAEKTGLHRRAARATLRRRGAVLRPHPPGPHPGGPEEVQRLEAALSSAHEYWWCAQPVATEPAAPAAGGGLEREAQRLRSSLCLVPSRRGAFRAEAAAVRQRWEAERAAQGAGRGRGRGRGADALLAAPLGTPRSPGALSERAALVPGGEHDRNRYEKNGRQTWSKGAWMSDRLRFHGKSRISAAERGGTSRILGRAPPPVHGFGDRAPNPWIANPCLRAPDMGTETDSRSSGGET